jgi:hypothetical protein
MDVYSTELGIRLSFGKTSEFREGFEPPPPRYATGLGEASCIHHEGRKHPMGFFCKLVSHKGVQEASFSLP